MNYEREQEIFNYFSSCVTAEDEKKKKIKNEKEKEKMQMGWKNRTGRLNHCKITLCNQIKMNRLKAADGKENISCL